ncbi:hypothetical protein GGS24DRAFT_517948 [Hypoxylon argillaceum]|nr:hypothetical protein GGS24DRAFT_517948 [Hypoxylon argillaceum]
MDPLSISSGIAGLVALVDLVYRMTTKYVKQVKDSSRSVKSLLTELKDFSILLHSLTLVAYDLELESGVSTGNTSSHNPNLKIRLVLDCQQILHEIKRCLANIDEDMSSSSAIKRVKARLKWPFSTEETNNLIENLQRHKQTINLAIAADSLEKLRTCISSQEDSTNKLDHIQTTVAEILDIQTRISLDRTTREVLRFFDRDINNASVFDMHKSRRHPLTCLWFTQGQEFGHWRDHPGSSIWITGIPGAGKSIISSAIIAECLQSTAYCHGVTSGTTSLAYFFCSYSDEKTHNIVNILSSLASQIARQDKRAFKMLETYHQDLHKHSQIPAKPSPKRLAEILLHMSTLFHQMYIVVDGLDECGDDVIAVAQALSKLPQDDKCLTLALLSRMDLHIQKWLEESFVHVEVEAHTEDIELYVAAELDERITSGQLRLKDVALKDQIILQLVQGARGMFRWVTCQIDHICELPTDRARRDALTKLPPTLYSTYERILNKVHASNIQARTIVQKTLLVIFSYSSSLSTDAICQIVSMPQDDTDTFEEDEVIEERELRLLCSSLVRTSPNGETLEFAHYTVQEFLVEICSSHPTLNFYQVDFDRASLLVGCACLKYLTLRNYERFPEDKDSEISYISQRNSSRPFYEYAAISWRNILTGHMEDDRVSRLLLILFDRKKSACFQAWSLELARHCLITHKGKFSFRVASRCGTSEAVVRTTISALLRPDFTTLHLAATLGLSNICEILLEEGADVNTKSLYGSPLHCAVGGLSVFADVNVNTFSNGYVALRDNDPEARNRTIQIMLGSGADILSRFSSPFRQTSMLGLLALNSMYGKDLMAAADLIKAGAEVEDEDLVHFRHKFDYTYRFLSPLEFKENLGNGIAITSLIEALGMPDNPGSAEYRLLALTSQFAQKMELGLATQTITHIALTVWVNDDNAMCAFLEKAVETNDVDALRAFIDNDRVAQVRSVRPLVRDEGCTLVHTAVAFGAVNCLRLLLGAGCSSDAPLSDGRTPAHLCYKDRDEDALRVLLEHQVSTNIQDEKKNTVWHYAAGANSAKILKLLLTQEQENKSALCLESLEGQTPICVALSSGHKEAVVALMQECPTLDFWKGGAYLYRDAAAIGSAQIVRKLLNVGVPLDAIGPNSESPLHFLGLRTDGECARLLVEVFPHCCLKMQNDKTIPLESYLTEAIEQTCAIDDETFRALLTGVDLSSSDYGPQIWGSLCSTIVGQLRTGLLRIYQRGGDREPIDPKWNQTCAYLIKEGALSAYEQAHNQSALIPFARKIYEVTKQEHIEERGSQGIEERRSPSFGPPGTRLRQSPQQVFPVQIWKGLSTMILAVADAASYWLDAEKDVLLTQLLCQAIIQDDTGLIQCLLNYGVNPGFRLDSALSPLELACLPAVEISEDNLRNLLSHYQSTELDGVGKALDTLGLLYLPDDHSLWKLKTLVESNLSFNQRPEGFRSWPLHACISKRANMCAEFLLDSGANPWQIEDEDDAVTLAIAEDNCSILSKILARDGKQSTNWKRKFGAEDPEFQGGNMLHLASAWGRTEILRFYLEEGLLADIEAIDDDLRTPMHWAAADGRSDTVQYLKDRGSRLDVVARGGFYPLHFAVQNQHIHTVQVLLSLGAEQKACALGLKPLAYAYRTGNLRLIQLLDENNGSEPPRQGLDHPTALRLMADAMEIALETNNLEACNYLIDQGCPVDIQLSKPWPVTPLMSAICASRSLQIVEWFLDQGAQRQQHILHLPFYLLSVRLELLVHKRTLH